MKIFIAHSSNCDFVNELYNPLKNCSLIKEHEITFPHDIGFNKITREIIQRSDLVIAEVSYPSTGQGIEIGWATVANIPVLCIHKKGSAPSGALAFVTKDFLVYTSPDDMIEQIKTYLANLN